MLEQNTSLAALPLYFVKKKERAPSIMVAECVVCLWSKSPAIKRFPFMFYDIVLLLLLPPEQPVLCWRK